MAMNLKGIKDAFTPAALKASLHAMGGGAAAGFLYSMAVGNHSTASWFDLWWKRVALAGVLGTVGAGLVKGKDALAASGIQGAMGAVIAGEIYGMMKVATLTKTASAAPLKGMLASIQAGVFAPPSGADRPMMSGAFNGTKVLQQRASAGGAFAGTQVRRAGALFA